MLVSGFHFMLCSDIVSKKPLSVTSPTNLAHCLPNFRLRQQFFFPFSRSASGMFCTGQKHLPIRTVHSTSKSLTPSMTSGQIGKSLLVDQLDQHCSCHDCNHPYIWMEKSKHNFNPASLSNTFLVFPSGVDQCMQWTRSLPAQCQTLKATTSGLTMLPWLCLTLLLVSFCFLLHLE